MTGCARRLIPWMAAVAAALAAASPAAAQTDPCNGSYIFCDDFNGTTIDTNKWTIADLNIANKYPVRPENIALATIDDNGTAITVVDAMSFGDEHSAAPRQGGVLISNLRYGGGRYEVRMKNLPGPNGCSCIWNYYDSRYGTDAPQKRVYTEVDIEMPAHMESPPRWARWRKIFGFNTWSKSDADHNGTFIQHKSTINPFDGQFHVLRFDWHDGSNGKRKIVWYVDGIRQASTTGHVSDAPAQLWVGTWPAPWAGMTYNFNIEHLYIDWVRISAFP